MKTSSRKAAIAVRSTASLLCCGLIGLSGCASMGLYQMSEIWCKEHPNASANRCPAQVLAKATTYCQYGEHTEDSNCLSNPRTGESWDQENLKRNDHGCPTAVFVAPGGNLEQCE